VIFGKLVDSSTRVAGRGATHAALARVGVRLARGDAASIPDGRESGARAIRTRVRQYMRLGLRQRSSSSKGVFVKPLAPTITRRPVSPLVDAALLGFEDAEQSLSEMVHMQAANLPSSAGEGFQQSMWHDGSNAAIRTGSIEVLRAAIAALEHHLEIVEETKSAP
jgi:hypothetical protein